MTAVSLPASESVGTDGGYALEMLFSVVTVTMLTGPLFALLANPGGQDSLVVNAKTPEAGIQAVLYLAAALLLSSRLPALAYAARRVWMLVALAAFAVGSVSWSVDPGRSLQAALGLSGSILVGSYLAIRWSAEEQLAIICTAVTVLLVCSVALALLEPRLGVDVGVHAGQWRGVFVTKNEFGRVMSLAVTVFVCAAVYVNRTRAVTILGAVAASILLLLSQSRTSALVAFLVCALGVLLRNRRRSFRWFVIVLVVLGLFVLPFVAVWTQRADLLTDRSADDSLTGRTKLWFAVLLQIAKHPWTGYGLRAFWSGRTGEYVTIWNYVGWSPPHAHNGFLDVALDLGAVGEVLLLGLCVQALLLSSRLFARQTSPLRRVWPTLLIAFAIVGNLTESTFLRSSLYWVLLVMAVVTAALGQPDATPKLTAPATDPILTAPVLLDDPRNS